MSETNPPQSTDSGTEKRPSIKQRPSFKQRRSSLFAAARASFYRTRGQSGASVETLRGTSGADFEGYATVNRGAEESFLDLFSCMSCFGTNDGTYFLLIKGYHCFVFKDEEATSPKYAIELMNRKAVLQPSHATLIPRVPHPGVGRDATYATVHLETSLGDVVYKFTFANQTADAAKGKKSKAGEFCGAVAVASNNASTEQVRKRLGHEGLLNKRSSVKYANTIGMAKAKDQPEAPLGAGELLAGMPTTETYA